MPEREPVGGLHPLAGLRNGNRSRQGNADFRKLAGARLDFSRPAVLLDDNVVADGKPQPGSLSRRFRRKKWVEHLLLHTWLTYRLSYAVTAPETRHRNGSGKAR